MACVEGSKRAEGGGGGKEKKNRDKGEKGPFSQTFSYFPSSPTRPIDACHPRYLNTTINVPTLKNLVLCAKCVNES